MVARRSCRRAFAWRRRPLRPAASPSSRAPDRGIASRRGGRTTRPRGRGTPSSACAQHVARRLHRDLAGCGPIEKPAHLFALFEDLFDRRPRTRRADPFAGRGFLGHDPKSASRPAGQPGPRSLPRRRSISRATGYPTDLFQQSPLVPVVIVPATVLGGFQKAYKPLADRCQGVPVQGFAGTRTSTQSMGPGTTSRPTASRSHSVQGVVTWRLVRLAPTGDSGLVWRVRGGRSASRRQHARRRLGTSALTALSGLRLMMFERTASSRA